MYRLGLEPRRVEAGQLIQLRLSTEPPVPVHLNTINSVEIPEADVHVQLLLGSSHEYC